MTDEGDAEVANEEWKIPTLFCTGNAVLLTGSEERGRLVFACVYKCQ